MTSRIASLKRRRLSCTFLTAILAAAAVSTAFVAVAVASPAVASPANATNASATTSRISTWSPATGWPGSWSSPTGWPGSAAGGWRPGAGPSMWAPGRAAHTEYFHVVSTKPSGPGTIIVTGVVNAGGTEKPGRAVQGDRRHRRHARPRRQRPVRLPGALHHRPRGHPLLLHHDGLHRNHRGGRHGEGLATLYRQSTSGRSAIRHWSAAVALRLPPRPLGQGPAPGPGTLPAPSQPGLPSLASRVA